MLAVQMVATHNAAMQKLRQLMIQQPSIEVIDKLSNQANKLMRTFAAQVEALNRHRNRGKQQIVVQHVPITADKAAVAVGGQPGGVSGGLIENGRQSYEQEQIGHEQQQLTHARVAPLRSEN